MKPAVKCCKTCKWIEAGKDSIGRRYINKYKRHTCTLPYSVAKHLAYWPPKNGPIYWDDGGNCSGWEGYKK